MAEARNCRKCGKIFSYLGGPPICPACKQADEEDFKRIKQYLYDYPGASLTQVSTELEIGIEKIKRFLKDGRLEITSDEGNMILECESCGKSIRSGRYCEDCERTLNDNLRSTVSQMQSSITNDDQKQKAIGMRYLNKEFGK